MDAQFMEGLGDLVAQSFLLLEAIGNSFNYFMIGVGFILMVIWVRRMAQYNREAAQNGTLK